MDVVLTAVAAVHTGEEYRVLSILSLGLPRSCAKRKMTVKFFCMHMYIYDGHAESKDSLAIKKDKHNKNKYNVALLQTLRYFPI